MGKFYKNQPNITYTIGFGILFSILHMAIIGLASSIQSFWDVCVYMVRLNLKMILSCIAKFKIW